MTPSSTDPAGVHDHDAVGDAGDHAEVVGDEHDRGADLVACLLDQQLEHLGLHGDVERGGGLVGDEHVGSQAIAMAIIARWRMPPENSWG